MPSNADGQEKTESASSRKRAQARKDGQIPRSQDLNASISLLLAMVLLWAFGGGLMQWWGVATIAVLSGGSGGNPVRVDGLSEMLGWLSAGSVRVVVPFVLLMVAVGVGVTAAQSGVTLGVKGLIPKPSKLNPWSGLKNIVNLRAGVRLGMSLGKLVVLAGIAGILVYLDLEKLLVLGELAPQAAFAAAAGLVLQLGLILASLLVLLAAVDYLYQRWQHEQDLKMTKEEARQEAKAMDGDPKIKQRRQQIARQLAMQRMAADVPTADVILTNPTHLSIALKYDPSTMQAPVVVAKGADHMALQIRRIAARHGVPVVERKPLARAIYPAVEVGQTIPHEHFAAVAEVLAYVYRLTGKAVA